MTNTRNTNPPKQSSGDIAHIVVKAGLAAIPLVGGSAAEIFSAVVVPPLTRRRDEWIQSLAEGLQELQERVAGFTIDSLQNNEVFVTAVMHATQVAIRNHHSEKREALRNALLNVASGNAPNEDMQLIFLDLVDTLVPWHLRLLRFFQNPLVYIPSNGVNPGQYIAGSGGVSNLIEWVFPEIQHKRPFYEQIVKTLYECGLITTTPGSLDRVTMTTAILFARRTTEMGNQFLQFIASPLE
jgi:hypothetical protein